MAAKKSTTSSKKKTSSGTKQSTTKKVEKIVKKEIKKGIRKNAKKKPLVALGLVVLLVAVTAAFAYLEKSGTTHVFHDAPADPVTFNGIVYDDLQINFMELGNWYTGDSVYIKAGTVDILIDAGSRKNSATRIEEFIDAHSEDKVLDYVIATHAHEDHIAGFSGTDKGGIFYKYQIGTIIDFAKTDSNSGIYKDYLAARDYAVEKGAKHYTALEAYKDPALKKIEIAKDIYFETLYQKYYEEPATTENNYSVCNLLTYKDQHYLFTGDLEKPGELSLVENNELPTCELYKAGHHGSKTSSSKKLLDKIQPKVVAVCCCAGSNEYTKTENNKFPTQEFINNVAPHTANIYVTSLSTSDEDKTYTSMNGDINFSSNGSEYSVACSNNNTILKETDWFKAHRTWPL